MADNTTIKYNSNYDLTRPFSNRTAQIALQANVAEVYTMPGSATDKYSVRFSYISTSNVFVRLNNTPSIPAGGTVASEVNNEFRPGADGTQRQVQGGDVLHFITPDATAYVGLSIMMLQG